MAGGYQAQPDDAGALPAQLLALARRLDALESGLKSVGMHIDGATGNLIVDANAAMSADFDGTLSPPAAGNNGWAGTDTAFIVNTLVAKNAIIDDDALTNPLDAYANGAVTTGTLSGTPIRATVTVPVPAGFSRAYVTAFAVGGMTATAAGQGFLSVAAFIDGTGPTISTWCGNSQPSSCPATFANQLTGLSGGTFDVQGAATTTGVCAAGQGNVRISTMALFLR